MTIQDQIRRTAAELKLELTKSQITRLVGTLRFSRVRTASNLDPLIRKELQRLVDIARAELPAVEVAATDAAVGRESAFKQIDDSLASGNCPRCGKKMREVKLADYSPARYCEGECRITLWPPEKK